MPAIRKAMPTGNQGTLQDSDSSDNDDSDFWSSSSGGMGVHEQKLYSDCEYLRQRNADLRDEIERVNGLYDRRQKEMEGKFSPPFPLHASTRFRQTPLTHLPGPPPAHTQ